MTLYIGDPKPALAQGVLPVEFTLPHALRVAELIEREGEDLYAHALQIGEPALRYGDFAQFVQSEGITVQWRPRGTPARTLTPDRAHRQYARLTADVPTQDRDLVVNGTLYRVIAEPREGRLGTVGIHLFSWSAKPPGRRTRTVIASYLEHDVEAQIKAGLIGEPVEALLLLRQPIPGFSLSPENYELVLASIGPGPPESSVYGSSIFEE